MDKQVRENPHYTTILKEKKQNISHGHQRSKATIYLDHGLTSILV